MVWKNPFLTKNSEQLLESHFLSLFDCTVLQIVDHQNLEKVSYVSSTPGAGKTSLFRAFSPEILNRAISSERKNDIKDFCNHMERLGVINGNKICLVSAEISCARGYTIIDEMFQNGRRKQIFFALLNYRIAIALLRSIGHLLEMDLEDFTKIQFAKIPSEMVLEANYLKDGKSLYDWACNGERQLCRYLDSDRVDSLEISFVHTTLLLLKLFEPENILVDGKNQFSNILIIFDDFHKLSENQKKSVSEAVYTLKTNVGVWLGQRFEGLKKNQLITMDGSLNRDYNPNIVIDNYWPNKTSAFYSMLERIADKRVKEAGMEKYLKFSDCISEDLENRNIKPALDKFIQSTYQKIQLNKDLSHCYYYIINYLNSDNDLNLLQIAIWYECIIIKENRKQSGQLSFYLGEQITLDEFTEFVKNNKAAARFYISYKLKIPFYYGFDNLKVLSSYNVEQFLFFAGAYFECCRVKDLEKKTRSRKKLTANEQENILKKAAREKWDDMGFRHSNVEEIKIFLDNIASVCQKSRDEERSSYAGGAYTGIGVRKEHLEDLIERSNQFEFKKYKDLLEILGDCLSSKYLERREINNGDIVVFYLNRWLCLYYELPLMYGGWKRCNMKVLLNYCKKTETFEDENQLTFDWPEE